MQQLKELNRQDPKTVERVWEEERVASRQNNADTTAAPVQESKALKRRGFDKLSKRNRGVV